MDRFQLQSIPPPPITAHHDSSYHSLISTTNEMLPTSRSHLVARRFCPTFKSTDKNHYSNKPISLQYIQYYYFQSAENQSFQTNFHHPYQIPHGPYHKCIRACVLLVTVQDILETCTTCQLGTCWSTLTFGGRQCCVVCMLSWHPTWKPL